MPFLEAASSDAAIAGTIRVTPTIGSRTTFPFTQTIELLEGDTVIASAVWFTQGDDGVIQLLDLRVQPDHRRKRVGTRLFRILMKEVGIFFKLHNTRPRRVLANAHQKTHIVARAFLTQMGFHHVQTLSNTLKNEDILVYLLGCD